MSSFWTQGILANLAQDRFAEGFGLTEQDGVEVKVPMIGTAILHAARETKPVGVRRFTFTLCGGMTP
jgi:hypothetical protein